ncbi:GGDEF domain-containing protein [Faecalicatena sp. AGMB00832]|uniref:GGDEF domain-containing protein n=1 Tax=Faecalicatena faecalis TaxID=2726362 RepID=A0ABS6D7R8_9FIRM|nr:GGDEF domain-containing protein [Faecalicatena faecalis]MBU3877227.1 GGDEF domain-containing protein [Faecalicatena faecalis]
MQKKIIPFIFTIALIISGFFALYSIGNVQGNARVVNYTGIVRGATQKLVKEELNGEPDDALIRRLDGILKELQTGEGDNNLIYLKDKVFQDQLALLQEKWAQIKEEIQNVRQGGDSEQLYQLSEDYFTETDVAVHDAEAYTERRVQHARWGLGLLTAVWLLVAAFVGFFTSRISKRQQEIQKIEDENRRKSEYLSVLAKQLQAPMNEMSELLYITDIETYELLFLNEAGQRTFNIKNFYGQKCYKILQGRESPCPFCNNDILKEGENVTWEHTNPITSRHYLLKDRQIIWDNRKARMEIAFDLTESESKKQQLQYLLDAEQMIVDCIHILYKKQNVERNIREVLEIAGKFLLADCAYYINIRDHSLVVEQEWHKDSKHALNIEYQSIPYEITQRWIKSFEKQKCLVIEDIEYLKEKEPVEYDMFKQYDVRCMIASSLEYKGEISGFIGLINPPADRVQHIVSFLQTLSYFIDLSIQQDIAQNQLAQLSYHDMLTSFYNRNRYIEDVQKFSKMDHEIGVIYLDINGLKEINDTYGHSRGDEVITAAAGYMKEVFPADHIYRIGGDEFVILSLHMEEDVFMEHVRRLKSIVQENPYLKIALGYRWSQHSREILSLIKQADADMYEDKRIYYQNHSKSPRYRHISDDGNDLQA